MILSTLSPSSPLLPRGRERERVWLNKKALPLLLFVSHSPVRLLSLSLFRLVFVVDLLLFSPFWQPTIFTLMDEKTTAHGERRKKERDTIGNVFLQTLQKLLGRLIQSQADVVRFRCRSCSKFILLLVFIWPMSLLVLLVVFSRMATG